MLVCRYVGGGASEIGDREYEVIGQFAEFSEEQFASVIRGGAAFLPESSFDSVGFTDAELDLNGPFGSRNPEDSEFQQKLATAQAAYLDIRARLLSGESVASLVGTTSAPAKARPAQVAKPAPARILKDEPNVPEAETQAAPLFGRQES